jgi:hypothetical protein
MTFSFVILLISIIFSNQYKYTAIAIIPVQNIPKSLKYKLSKKKNLSK